MYTIGLGVSSEELIANENKRAAQAQQVAGYAALAQAGRGSTLKWILYGTGGLLVVGGIALWLVSRRKGK